MSKIEKLNVKITSRNHRELDHTIGQIQKVTFDQKEKLQNAIKMAGTLFVLTLLSAVIPGLHFILVPLGLIVTIVMSVKTFSQASKIIDGSGTCPKCKKGFRLEPGNAIFPYKDTCSNCFDDLQAEFSETQS